MKTDRHHLPYRHSWERLLTTQKRIRLALKRCDLEVLVGFVEHGQLCPQTRLSPLKRPKNIPSYIDNGQSLLHACVSQKEDTLVLRLLQQGADPNIKTFFNETPLHYAARKRNKELLCMLIAFGGDMSLRPSKRGTYVEDMAPSPSVLEIYQQASGQNITQEELEKEAITKALPQKQPPQAPVKNSPRKKM